MTAQGKSDPHPHQQQAPISSDMLKSLGASACAYMRPMEMDGHTLYAVHAANGEALTICPDLATATALIRLNGLEPMRVH